MRMEDRHHSWLVCSHARMIARPARPTKPMLARETPPPYLPSGSAHPESPEHCSDSLPPRKYFGRWSSRGCAVRHLPPPAAVLPGDPAHYTQISVRAAIDRTGRDVPPAGGRAAEEEGRRARVQGLGSESERAPDLRRGSVLCDGRHILGANRTCRLGYPRESLKSHWRPCSGGRASLRAEHRTRRASMVNFVRHGSTDALCCPSSRVLP
jgi:hypothetical protein